MTDEEIRMGARMAVGWAAALQTMPADRHLTDEDVPHLIRAFTIVADLLVKLSPIAAEAVGDGPGMIEIDPGEAGAAVARSLYGPDVVLARRSRPQ